MEYDNPEIPEGINVSKEHPLKEFAVLVGGVLILLFSVILIVGFAAESLAHLIPFEVERKITSSFDLTETESLTDHPVNADSATNNTELELQKYLQGLARRIAIAQDLPDGMVITLHYDSSEMINAFATLGGHVILFRGLLEKLPNENALAMVVAHEIAHIKHRHPIESLGRSAVIGIAIAAITGATDNAMLGSILSDTGMLTALSFNRDQEKEADETALMSLNRLYGHIGGAKDLFEVFEALEADKLIQVPELFQTHPLTTGRIEKINQTAIQNGWKIEGDTIALPDRFSEWMAAGVNR